MEQSDPKVIGQRSWYIYTLQLCLFDLILYAPVNQLTGIPRLNQY